MNIKINITLLMMLAATHLLAAGYLNEFQNAEKLFKTNNINAHKTFMQLAEKSPTPESKAECLKYAALCLGRQKEYEKAIELAKTIKSRPFSVYVQMEIMLQNSKHQELVNAFENEDIGTWTDKIKYQGFLMRGSAYKGIKQYEKAKQDFEECAKNSGSDLKIEISALNELGKCYQDLGDNANAIVSYRKSIDKNHNMRGSFLFFNPILGLAEILKEQKRYAEALAVLDEYKFKQKLGMGEFFVLEARGDIVAEQGHSADSLKLYEKANSIMNVHPSLKKRIDNKIAQIKRGKE